MPSKRELLRLANEKNQAKRLQAIGSAEHSDTVTDAIVDGLPVEAENSTNNDGIVSSPATPVQEQPDFSSSAQESDTEKSVKEEKAEAKETQMTTTKLSDIHERFLKIRATQQHYSQLKYVEKLILDFKDAVENGRVRIDPFSFQLPYMGRYVMQKSLIMQKSSYLWLCEYSASIGLKKTDFINYLIELDMQQYQKEQSNDE